MVPFQMWTFPVPEALMHPYAIRDVDFWTEHWSQTIWSLSSLLMSFGPEKMVASSLHDRALTSICVWHSESLSQTMVSGSVSEPIEEASRIWLTLSLLYFLFFCNVFLSLCFHLDLQDREHLSPERAASVEPVRELHRKSGKPAGIELFDWT